MRLFYKTLVFTFFITRVMVVTGGEMKVQSKEGQGAEFTIVL